MSDKPKIVIWDLETLPDPEAVYDRLPSIGAWQGRTFKADLHTLLCFGYKIYGEEKAHSINAWELGDSPDDEIPVLQFAYDVLHDADEIVTHNGRRFDLKFLNTRLMYYGMPPLDSKIKHVDTKVVLKSKLSLYSNSLSEAAKFFGIIEKMHWNDKWSTWKRFAFGRQTEADKVTMDTYCKQDVDVLEQLWLKTRPLHENSSVNKQQWRKDIALACPICGSINIARNGTRRSKKYKYRRYLCGDCGSSFKGSKIDE